MSDAVLAARDPATRDDPRLPYHQRWVWDGSPVDGRHVLVRCYHGLGDTVQYARFLPFLSRRAASLTVEAQPAILPLLQTMPGVCGLKEFDVDAPAANPGCDVEIMELSHALRMTAQEAPAPYVKVTPSTMPARAVGLCIEAGGWNSERSIDADLFTELGQTRSVFLLQPRPLEQGVTVLNPQGCAPEIIDVAREIAGLPLVITVDTMIAHLAGALGQPTWLLLKHDADWRWMEGRTTSTWYPSMRLYRQPSPGDWHSVVRQVMHDLSHVG